MKMFEPLFLQHEDLSLKFGKIVEVVKKENYSAISISPSEQPLFDQVICWLDQKPSVPIELLTPKLASIGATSLCFRWGTWMGWLTADNRPINSNAKDEEISLINNSEMKRMNIELSYNIGRLLELLFSNSSRAMDLLYKASIYLPIKWKKNISTRIGMLTTICLALYMQKGLESENLDSKTLYRKMGNLVANTIYRNNSPLEAIHAGKFVTSHHPFTHRRINQKQSNDLFTYIANQFSVLFSNPIWNGGYKNWDFEKIVSSNPSINLRFEYLPELYPNDWTTIDSSSEIVLYDNHTEHNS